MEKNYQENKKKEYARSDGKQVMAFEVMVRRFNRQVQQNRLLSETKKRRFHEKELTRREKRQIARHKVYVKKLKRGY